MKKNVMLKIAAVLLVAVLLSTCAISATFAKYATTGKAYADTARVAKWGVTVTTTLDNSDSGFGAKYYTADDKWVESRTGDKVVAPGTSGTLELALEISIVDPEVSGEVKITDADGGQNYLVDNTGKLVWKINGVEKTVGEVNAAIAALNCTFTPESDDITLEGFEITWEWPFDVSAEEDGTDTTLGEAGTATVSFSIKADVVQTGPAGAKD